MTIEEAIEATLEAWRRERFRWGKSDCALSMADYARLLADQDPAAAWRGRYRSAGGAERFIRRAGSLADLFRSGMPTVGARLVPESDVRRGDVVICEVEGNQVAGLHLGDLIAFRSPKALGMSRHPVVEGWRCA